MKITYSVVLQGTRDLGDALLKWFSIAAIIIGGWWTWHIFDIADSGASNLQMNVSTETKPYSIDKRILIVDVQPKNIGKVPIEPGKDGLVLTLRSIPAGLGIGHVAEDKLPLFQEINITKEYDSGYILEPGVEYHEAHAFIVSKDSSYMIKADFDLGPDEKGVDTDVDVSNVAVVQ